MKARILETLVLTITGMVVTFLFSALIAYFTENNPEIKIGSSSKIQDNQYYLPIVISTFEKGINNLTVSVPANVKKSQIKSSEPLNIKNIENNIGTENGSVFEVNKIPANKNTQLVLITNKSIDDEKIEIYSDKSKLNLQHSSEIQNPISSQIKSILINTVVYGLLIGLLTYWSDKRRDEKIKNARERTEDVQRLLDLQSKEIENLNLNSDRIKEHSEKIEKKQEKAFDEIEQKLANAEANSIKKQILLQAKLNDYRKELNFWRNTIRKILYKLPDGENKATDLFNLITKSLKTYQTNEKYIHDFESLKALSKYIEDIDKKE
ncbi:hypothetical protein QUF79_06125 [Fictibacillus enclensis]|uniref:hypothetical protein n=1 Tax=Fictibacillus enclensis TaxID=1017270 RepID=UPI0025A14440|nr:hypothetical protein [Fictibacillus enclensis]MDM5197592.1 hypothetical protein [Fictibacillus enclensis]